MSSSPSGSDEPRPSFVTRLHRLNATRSVSVVNSRMMHRLDNLIYRLSGKRTTFLGLAFRLPVITLTTTGAKTGQPRTLPLIGVRDDQHPGTIAVIASNWGQAHSPAWYYNLKHTPHADGTIHGKTLHYEAREVDGDEYERLWRLAVRIYAGYEVYKKRAAHRHIPIIVLTPQP